LDVLDGTVIAQCKPRHRHQEFLGFLRTIEANVPQDLDIHLIVDNYSTHKHAKVKAWLAARPRWHIHFTPTYSSWLNQVERFFGLITDKAIRRGSFQSVKELVSKIDHFVTQHNKHCKPFAWIATAVSILAKLERLTSRISGTAHYAVLGYVDGAAIRTELCKQQFPGISGRIDKAYVQWRARYAAIYDEVTWRRLTGYRIASQGSEDKMVRAYDDNVARGRESFRREMASDPTRRGRHAETSSPCLKQVYGRRMKR
jgi:putative transposase